MVRSEENRWETNLISTDQLFILSSVITEQDRRKKTPQKQQKAKPCFDNQVRPPSLSGLKEPHNSHLERLGEVWKGLPCPAHLGALGRLQIAFEAGPEGEYRAPTRNVSRRGHQEDSAQSCHQSVLLCFTVLILYLVLLPWDCPWDCISTHWRLLRVLAQSASQWGPSMFLEEKWNHLRKTRMLQEAPVLSRLGSSLWEWVTSTLCNYTQICL